MNPKQQQQSSLYIAASKSGFLSPTFVASLALVCVCGLSPFHAGAQSPSALYTWDNTGNAAPNIETWVRNFGAGSTSATLDNSILGQLTIIETSIAPGGSQAFTDGANRVRESSTAAGGGTDLTGLDYLEYEIGHNGAGNINVQFFVQASTGFNFVSLGPDLVVTPGINTYQVPLSGLTADQAVYIRTMGFNARDHAGLGNVTWTLRELRSGGTPLTTRNLITHDIGTPELGLQGAIVNFDNTAVLGNNGGQNQTGFSHNPAGSGSLRWTDVGGQNGAAISWGNGTAWNGNTFNNRTTDLSNYDKMILRISATDPNAGGGTLGLNAFFQKNNFQFENPEGGAGRNLPIDGQFYDLEWSLAGLANMNVVDLTGINLFSHLQDLEINVDNIRFEVVPEPSSGVLLFGGLVGIGLAARRDKQSSLKRV
ncbi:MAG: PEP-CTERM sorting domain-containing protein [Verrucomicrobia bacterium]|nr:PEP-CTERM sorting domain-containing protein [Verrucomicrobiota bacterium]